ncbi:MAG TPA: hypothetical protein VGQ48_03195, partial [Gemmatimonadales bacterium]|nr:hypothetical protein [Gemmatimonadales bacterium]
SALMLACSDRAPLPLAAGPGPAFDFTNGPESPGESGILRFNDLWIEGIADPEAGYRAIHGLVSLDDFCNAIGGLNEVSLQVKTLHADEVNALVVEREQPVQVFAFVPGPICTVLRGVTPIASGTVRWRRTDNNFTATGSEGGRANAFGQRAEGVVNATAGGTLHYMAQILLLVDPKTEELTFKTRKVMLH